MGDVKTVTLRHALLKSTAELCGFVVRKGRIGVDYAAPGILRHGLLAAQNRRASLLIAQLNLKFGKQVIRQL